MLRLRNAVQQILKRYWTELFVLALYLVLTLVLLYPFSVLNMGTQLIGDGGDGWQGMWSLWSVKQSVLSFSNPYVTTHVFYPQGADLAVHTLSPAAGFFTIPFQVSLGLVFTYNLLVIASFVLGGYGAYRLAYHVTLDRKASFFSGLVFGFSAYHFARAFGHLNLFSIQWIPFYVLFLLKMRHEKSLKNVLFAVAFLLLAGLMADLQYMIFLALLTAFYVLKELLFNRNQLTPFLKRLGIMLIIFLGLFALFMAPLMYGYATGKYSYATPPPTDSVTFSADVVSFFTPSTLNPFFGKGAEAISTQFSTSLSPIEGVTYLGYSVLAIAIYAVLKVRKAAKYWLVGALVFLVLALGPILHVMGTTSFTSLHVDIPLPELLLVYAVPVFRAPARFVLIATLCLAVVSALSLKHINKSLVNRRKGKLLSLILLAVLSGTFLAESCMLPFPVVNDTSVPPFYYQLAQVNGTFSVLDFPQNYVANNRYMYYGTVSGKPLFAGAISRVSPANIAQMDALPLIKQTEAVLNGRDLTEQIDILLRDANATNLNALYFFEVKYIVLHRYLMDNASTQKIASYLTSLLGSAVYSDDKTIAFIVPNGTQTGLLTYLGDGGWLAEESRYGLPTRWMTTKATVQILSPSDQQCSIRFRVGTDNANKTLKINLNGELVSEGNVATIDMSDFSMNGTLKKGVNELSFTCDKSFVPADVGGELSDLRKLSLFFQNVEIKPR